MIKLDYDRIFEAERLVEYPVLDVLESATGFAVDRSKLESAARVLACPFKKNPPNWQHGRVVYAVASQYLARAGKEQLRFLDIGTAKGFSALCAQWAINDSGKLASVTSLDVIDPKARVLRNTVVEVNGPLTLAETLEPWREDADRIAFAQATAFNWLSMNRRRVHFAFVDGKHNYPAVKAELELLGSSQERGDVVVLDDVQIVGVRRAVDELEDYDVQWVDVLPLRKYAIARKR